MTNRLVSILLLLLAACAVDQPSHSTALTGDCEAHVSFFVREFRDGAPVACDGDLVFVRGGEEIEPYMCSASADALLGAYVFNVRLAGVPGFEQVEVRSRSGARLSPPSHLWFMTAGECAGGAAWRALSVERFP